MVVGNENDIAALTAVTAVGSARGYVFFSVECNGTVTAVTCLYSYFICGSLSPLTVICSVFLGVFVIWCHRANIKRLLDRNEKKISVGKRKKD